MCYFIWFSFKIYFLGGNNLKLKVSSYWYNNLDPDPKKTGRNFNFDFCVAACWPRRLWQPPGKPSPWAPSGQPPWTRFQVLIFNRHTSTGTYFNSVLGVVHSWVCSSAWLIPAFSLSSVSTVVSTGRAPSPRWSGIIRPTPISRCSSVTFASKVGKCS